ncbi:MAG: fructose-1,6-bisphosphatase [Clostridia bacterium]|nr:fructose-1,6-bisphosphatase [Clostridia bacterium]
MTILQNNTYNINYLELLSNDYPSVQAVSAEIINLRAILSLPKGTEHFISDLHGEYEAVLHVLRNASGVIKNKIDMLYSSTVTASERKTLATLVYYPERKLSHLKNQGVVCDEWYSITLYRLVDLCRLIASKYTRSKVRKAMPRDFSYIIDELLHTTDAEINKHEYYTQIIRSIIGVGRADAFIIALSNLIRRLSIDHLHILGDIFDRGPRADIIMDELTRYHSIDFQWGNHDIEWIGAACGNDACIANVIRNSLRYNNFDTLEIGYGINTRTLTNLALEVYGDDKCEAFIPLDSHKKAIRTNDAFLTAKMQKAIAIIQFKLEGQLIARHPEYEMSDRTFLDKIDFQNGIVTIDGEKYPLTDKNFPTVNFSKPYELTEQEKYVVESLRRSFIYSEKLQEHIGFLIKKGGMYKIHNGNLLFHGCIPLDSSGKPDTVAFFGEKLSGKAYLDAADLIVRKAFATKSEEDSDFLWYLWCGKKSPLFGKNKLSAFENYFTNDEKLSKEEKNNYYLFTETRDLCHMLFEEFSLDPASAHIINGHVPVKTGKGESPIKANGKLYIIDGGFSKPYQLTTGIAGYTLISNSYGLSITEHETFTGVNDVIENDSDLHSSKTMTENYPSRKRVADTDNGERLKNKIKVLTELLEAYKSGLIREKHV